MKKVDIVYSGWLEAPNGASKFLSGLKCSADSFSDLNVDMNIICLLYTSDAADE